VQAVNTPPSSLHWVGSLALKEKLAEVELVGLAGSPPVIVTVGGVASIVHV
jgi:hypothetical protein